MKFVFFYITLFLLIASISLSLGQNQPLEINLSQTYGKEKIVLLHQIIGLNLEKDSKKASKYAEEAVKFSEQILRRDNHLIDTTDLYLRVKSYYLLALSSYANGDFEQAKENIAFAQFEADKLNYYALNTDIKSLSAKLEKEDAKSGGIGNFFKEKWGNLGLGEKIGETTQDFNISATERLATSFEENQQFRKAIDQYNKLINYYTDQGNWRKVLELREKIGDLYVSIFEYEKAIPYYEQAAEIAGKAKLSPKSKVLSEKINQTLLTIVNEESKGSSQLNAAYYDQIKHTELDSADYLVNNPEKARQDLKRLADQMEAQSDYKKSLEYYKLYTEIQDLLEMEESEKEKAILANELLQQEKEIQELTIAQKQAEITKQTKFRNNILIGSILLFLVAIGMYLLYTSKRKAHSKLAIAYTDLESTQKQLSEAEKRIKTLLHQQVSSAVANALLAEKNDSKIERKNVCIMFLDIRDFTPFAESRNPEEIIDYQNKVFGIMIRIIEKHQGIINQFLGDGFMATFGAPISSGCDCDNALKAGKEIIETIKNSVLSNEIPITKVGIGLHAGPVVAGNVGTAERKQYSITGNTVIIAARIEQLNKQLNSQLLISEEVYAMLKSENGFDPEFREFKIKGRSENIRVATIM